MLAILEGLRWLEQCRGKGIDPQTGSVPRGKAGQKRLAAIDADMASLHNDYEDLIAVYADAFGDGAATALNEYVRKQLTGTNAAVQQVLFPLSE